MNRIYQHIRSWSSWMIFLGAITCMISACKQEQQEFDNLIFIRQIANSPTLTLALDSGSGTVALTVGSSYSMDATEDISVEILGQEYLNEFNKKNFTEYQLVPKSAVELSSPSVTIAGGTALGKENVMVTVKEWPEYIDGVQYVVPVKINPGRSQVLSGSDVALVLVTKTTVGFAAQNAAFPIPVALFGPEANGKAYDNFTFEGRFNMTQALAVPGNWRADIFNGSGLQFLVFADGKIDVRFPNSAFMTTTATATLNTWYHFAITYASGVVTLYINGIMAGQTPYPGLKLSDCAITPYATGTGTMVSEFRIWNTLRTAKQLRSFVCAVNPSDPGLLGYWKLNDGNGNEAMDSSGKNNQLTSSTDISWVPGVRCPQ
ncbi:concanavalin A-like lectin/glucanase superfamily protein [Sphingobacterium sp. JUb20]|nr:concanavalin A-like lectin/glucanase superfamily protein [Sphingobacterium sp. JUb20]